MITALDTNIVVGVIEGEHVLASRLATILDRLADDGQLIIAPIVYAELLAAPSRSPALIDALLLYTPILVDWSLDEPIWRAAGLAYKGYVLQRRMEGVETAPRRIAADFLIGAHALERNATLLTWDEGVYRTYFPGLETFAP